MIHVRMAIGSNEWAYSGQAIAKVSAVERAPSEGYHVQLLAVASFSIWPMDHVSWPFMDWMS